jgi:hypothetical protein
MAIGERLTASANNSMVMGKGKTTGNLVNNIQNSLMIGFDTTDATVFVGGSDHRVGIGTTAPAEKFDVNGTAQVTGFKMPTGATNGYVLTSDATGLGTWQPGGDGDWTISGDNVYSSVSGNVGIGDASPTSKLDVVGDINTSEHYEIDGTTVLSTPGTNTFVGDWAGISNTTGYANTFVGRNAGDSNEDGFYNTFVGRSAGSANTSGRSNTFIGDEAGLYNTTGLCNTFIGNIAGRAHVTGDLNTFMGFQAGASADSSRQNTFLGAWAGHYTHDGNYNTSVGYEAGKYHETGSFNTYIGHGAGKYNISGTENTFIGNFAGYRDSTGSGNVFIGHYSGYYERGSNKLHIDNNAVSPLIYGEFDNEIVEINGDLTVNGKVNSTGGYDPPYVLYDRESRKAIVDRVADEVPEEKMGGAVLFWNSESKLFEVYLPQDGEFRDLDGNLIGTVREMSSAR